MTIRAGRDYIYIGTYLIQNEGGKMYHIFCNESLHTDPSRYEDPPLPENETDTKIQESGQG